jgi:thiol-disulfide isomerase/thioredoxin
MVEELTVAFSQKYAIDGTPTFLFFREGQVKDRLLGQVDVTMLIDFVIRNSGVSRE